MKNKTLYRIDWKKVIRLSLLGRVEEKLISHRLPKADRTKLVSLLAEIVESVGGPAVTTGPLSLRHCTAMAETLLADAWSRHHNRPAQAPEVHLSTTDEASVVTPFSARKKVTSASLAHEYFSKTVLSLSALKLKKVAPSCRAKALLALGKKVLASVLKKSVAKPEPFSSRLPINAKKRTVYPAAQTDVLANSDYYRQIPKLLDAAKKTIKVLMFHIAFPSQKHPTFKLLQSLADARKRGVSVKVLVDNDRAEDPYKSTVINLPALQFLNKNDIECRLDKPEKLLHSKVVLIDHEKVVIGSHNWTAGSYFQYGDVSLCIKSKQYARFMEKRFDRLWKTSAKFKM